MIVVEDKKQQREQFANLQVESTHSINGFQSVHGLIHQNEPVDITQLEADDDD